MLGFSCVLDEIQENQARVCQINRPMTLTANNSDCSDTDSQ